MKEKIAKQIKNQEISSTLKTKIDHHEVVIPISLLLYQKCQAWEPQREWLLNNGINPHNFEEEEFFLQEREKEKSFTKTNFFIKIRAKKLNIQLAIEFNLEKIEEELKER